MKKILLQICLLIPVYGFSSPEPKYPVSEIPPDLKEQVNIVVREDQMKYTIRSQSEGTLYVREVITILNENGKRYATEVIGYDKLSKVTTFKGASYDAQGNLIKRLKTSEIYDQSAYDGFSLYSDNRIKVAQLSHGAYPYTVEFEYEISYSYLFMIPTFVIIPGEKASVQTSSYQLIFPAALTPKYKVYNYEAKAEEGKSKEGKNTLTWNFHNLKPLKFEPMSSPVQDLIPQISVAPIQFEFDGYKGSTESWDKFGNWIIALNKGRNQLPEEAKNKVIELTNNLHTTEEKIKAIYEYMQNRTRYVSIQLGIGGFQPFEASVVDKTGYGDCKALSNYMVALLDVAGIKANYTLIRAGKDAASLKEDFPSSQFNHAVVFVPMGTDTVWLECTSQTNPFGYMGSFTGDRKALAITANGAKIVETPVYDVTSNIQTRTATVNLTEDGNATALIKTSYSGLKYESDGLHFILENQFDEQKKWVERNTSIPVFNINSYKIENHKAKIPTAIVHLDLKLNRFASVSGKRMFITPNLMNRSTYIPEKVENRKTNVVRRFAYTDIDTIKYQMPDGIYPEFLPDPVKFKSPFGEYESSYILNEKGLLYIRRVRINKGEFPADSYNELIDFYKSVSKADNQKLVFLNKT
jgi:hypothetical protein